MKNKDLDLLTIIAQTIFDKKGFNILVLDVRSFSTMTNYCIIAEGNVDRHVKAISQALRDSLKPLGVTPFHVEGDHAADWLVMDYGWFMVHLFTPEMREKYALEELWSKGAIVDVTIDIPKGDGYE